MFARMMSSTVKRDAIDESMRIWREDVIPAAKQQAGFLGVTLLIDRDTGSGSSITFWESLAALEAAESTGFVREQSMKLAAYLVGPTERRVYEVPISIAPSSELPEHPSLLQAR